MWVDPFTHPAHTPTYLIHAYDPRVQNKISRNHNNFACSLLHHFIYDVVVILFVFLCFLGLPSGGGSVLSEPVLLVGGPPCPSSGRAVRWAGGRAQRPTLEGPYSSPRDFIKYVTTLRALIGFREAWEGGREVVACEGEAEEAEEAGKAEVDM
jgi:hypothetical protein